MPPASTGPSRAAAHVFVWTGDAERTDSDFLAVLDADPASPTYGAVVTTLAVDAAGTDPHHTDHQMPPDGVLWANGFGSGDVFRFDLRDPRAPRLLGRFVVDGPFMHPHSVARLADGRVLATLQMRGHANAEAGALVELDAEGHLLRASDAADPDADPFIRPYSLAVVPALDRVVTTSADMHATEPSHVVQVWRLGDLSRVATVRLPPGPRGDEGVDPAEPRVLADGRTVLVSTFSCDLYRLDDLDTDAPSADFVHGFAGTNCALPVVAGRYWVQTVPDEHALVALDVSDPARPREAGRLTLAETDGPHWIALDPGGTRIVISGGGGTLERRVLLATLDPATGALALDDRFRDAGASAPGVSFDRAGWSHGATGPAIPHGAVFSRPAYE
nr:selenium-binding protein SBP56-related protein [Rubrivirga marina]